MRRKVSNKGSSFFLLGGRYRQELSETVLIIPSGPHVKLKLISEKTDKIFKTSLLRHFSVYKGKYT